MQKILVTGLSFSGNRGAAAMAISFLKEMKKYLDYDFVFSVAPIYYDLEKKWASYYGVEIVSEKTEQYRKALKDCLCIVNLNGIAFVGDGTRKWYASLYEHRCFLHARKYQKPFFRFIQSYGPFDDWRVRLIAKREFKKLPCIMARGKLSASYCKKITNRPVYSFPDIAITLAGNKADLKNYIVLCPSAVTARINRKKYISLFKDLVNYYNKRVILLPHSLSPDKNKSDRVLCREINKELTIEKDLDCQDLKGIIAGADFAVVSRYHALVAALSSGVPVVSIGWNDKYQDIMDFYNCSEFALDFRKEIDVFAKLNDWTDEKKETIKKRQKELEIEISKACQILANWVHELY